MRVCLAVCDFPPFTAGGIATFYANLARLLSDAGHEVTVLTSTPANPGTAWRHAGVQVVRIEESVAVWRDQLHRLTRRELWRAAESVAIGLAMRDWLCSHAAEMRFQVVESTDYPGSAALLVDAELPPLVVTCHGSRGQAATFVPERGISHEVYGFISALEVITLSTADEVVTHSFLNQADWSRYLGRSVSFARAPVNLTSGQERPSVNSNQMRGVVVGRLERLKGPLETLEALKICVQRGLDVYLHWIGADTSEGPGGSSMVEHLRQSYSDLWLQHFEWSEELSPSEIRTLRASADFALVPSRFDVLNYTAIEAMQAGLPLVVTSSTGMTYLARHRENCLLVPPEDSLAIADSLQLLAENPDLRTKIGQCGQATVMREFDPRDTVEERLRIYEAAIDRHAYRVARDYCKSAVHPLILQWLGAADVPSYLDSFRTRSLARETARRVLKRFRRVP